MKYMRYLLILMGIWVFLVDDIGVWLGVPQLSAYAYLVIAACAVLPILFPPADRHSPFVIFSASILLLILFRAWDGDVIEQGGWHVIVVEIGAIAMTIALASLLGAQINTIQEIFRTLGMSKLQRHVDTFVAGQHAIYREIRWARRYQRHLALLAVSLNPGSFAKLLDRQHGEKLAHRLAKEAQSDVWRSYATTKLAKLLVDELGDQAIVTQRQEHFVVVLTEVDREQAAPVIERLKVASEARLGIGLDVGIAIFPDEAVTFEALLQQAETAMAGTAPVPGPGTVFKVEPPRASAVAPARQEVRASDEVISSV